jgi:hypothetical protein
MNPVSRQAYIKAGQCNFRNGMGCNYAILEKLVLFRGVRQQLLLHKELG